MANTCGYCQTGMTIRYGRTKGGNGRVRCTQCGKTKVVGYLVVM